MVEHHADHAVKYATRIWELIDGIFTDTPVTEWVKHSAEGEEE